ncbi:cyclase family protein [Legionella brunensis]|uniref:Metal-dependent hydrolase n=1 Tax=Legionella brunensis TaxID=29422 RepID=A0A0W0SLA5_9GAMM|nr:cyclase family protein [Legionella brunensis]KTC84049.1 metal-dependent hydrolase [Legionella brunensis]
MTFPYVILDLTHTLSSSIPSWEGTCGFQHQNIQDYESDAAVSFRVQRLTMDAGIGTHLDAPAHCIKGGKTIAELHLNELIAPCVVIDVSKAITTDYKVDTKDILDFEATNGKINRGSFVIVRTGWEQYWGQPEKYHNNHMFPCLGLDAAELLLQREVVGLGIDTLSPDRPNVGYLVHQAFLGAGKYIVENVANAVLLPPIGSYILILPLKIAEATEAPVRLIALVKRK